MLCLEHRADVDAPRVTGSPVQVHYWAGLEEGKDSEEEAAVLDPNNLFSKEKRPSYLHFIYDKHDIPARIVQQLHSKHCSSFEKKLGLLPPKICYLRPKNIGDLATQAIVREPPGKPASYFMGEHQKRLDP